MADSCCRAPERVAELVAEPSGGLLGCRVRGVAEADAARTNALTWGCPPHERRPHEDRK